MGAYKGLLGLIVVITLVSMFVVLNIWADVRPGEYTSFLKQDQVDFQNVSAIYLTKENRAILNSRYQTDTQEFIYCLQGQRYQDGYVVTKMTETKVVNATADSISYEKCPYSPQLIGTIHSHPASYRQTPSCALSKQDIYTFGAENTQLIGVICGADGYAFYSPKDFEHPFKVVIVETTTKV